MLTKLHAAVGTLGLMIIAGFWSATAISELFGTSDQIAMAKTAILYGMALLIPSLAAAGITGARLGRGMKLPQVAAKTTGGLLILTINDAQGRPVQVERLQATMGRATHVKDDFTPAFEFDGTAYIAPAELAPGNWNLRMTAEAADGSAFTQRIVVYVRG